MTIEFNEIYTEFWIFELTKQFVCNLTKRIINIDITELIFFPGLPIGSVSHLRSTSWVNHSRLVPCLPHLCSMSKSTRTKTSVRDWPPSHLRPSEIATWCLATNSSVTSSSSDPWRAKASSGSILSSLTTNGSLRRSTCPYLLIFWTCWTFSSKAQAAWRERRSWRI